MQALLHQVIRVAQAAAMVIIVPLYLILLSVEAEVVGSQVVVDVMEAQAAAVGVMVTAMVPAHLDKVIVEETQEVTTGLVVAVVEQVNLASTVVVLQVVMVLMVAPD